MSWAIAFPDIRRQRLKNVIDAQYRRFGKQRGSVPQDAMVCDLDAVESGGAVESQCRFINCTFVKGAVVRTRGRCLLSECTFDEGADVYLDGVTLESANFSGKCSLVGTYVQRATCHNVSLGRSEIASSDLYDSVVGDGCYVRSSMLSKSRIGSECVVQCVNCHEGVAMADGAMVLRHGGNSLASAVVGRAADADLIKSYINGKLVMGEGARLLHGYGSWLQIARITLGPGSTLALMASCSASSLSVGRRGMALVNNEDGTVALNSRSLAGRLPSNVAIRVGADAFLKLSLTSNHRTSRGKAQATLEVKDKEAAVLV